MFLRSKSNIFFFSSGVDSIGGGINDSNEFVLPNKLGLTGLVGEIGLDGDVGELGEVGELGDVGESRLYDLGLFGEVGLVELLDGPDLLPYGDLLDRLYGDDLILGLDGLDGEDMLRLVLLDGLDGERIALDNIGDCFLLRCELDVLLARFTPNNIG